MKILAAAIAAVTLVLVAAVWSDHVVAVLEAAGIVLAATLGVVAFVRTLEWLG